MYQNKKKTTKIQSKTPQSDVQLDASLKRAVETIKQQANSYQLAGMTHISSLLE